MTEPHELLKLAELFEREGNGPRDVLTGDACGGPWGAAFCDRVATAMRNALGALAPVTSPLSPVESDTLSDILDRADDYGISAITIWAGNDYQVNVQFADTTGWRCYKHPDLITALHKALLHPSFKMDGTNDGLPKGR